MKIGLFFGTFNPIHVGHLIIGNHLVENSDLDALWFMVTPLNPHKQKKSLLADTHRLAMVRVAVESYAKLQASDFEFKLSINPIIHPKIKIWEITVINAFEVS